MTSPQKQLEFEQQSRVSDLANTSLFSLTRWQRISPHLSAAFEQWLHLGPVYARGLSCSAVRPQQ
jgi:hypothetical protein